jgi:hypothetical protein
VSASSMSLVNNTNLVSKVYFPRLCVPTASMVVYLVDLLVATVVLMAAMAWYGVGGGRPDTAGCRVRPDGVRGGTRPLPVVVGDRRPLPRCTTRRAVHAPVRSLRDPRRVLELHGRGSVAPAVRAQPHGGRRRRIPVVDAGDHQRHRRASADVCSLDRRDPCLRGLTTSDGWSGASPMSSDSQACPA